MKLITESKQSKCEKCKNASTREQKVLQALRKRVKIETRILQGITLSLKRCQNGTGKKKNIQYCQP